MNANEQGAIKHRLGKPRGFRAKSARGWCLVTLIFSVGVLPVVAQNAGDRAGGGDLLRGGRVGWARLKTPDGYWERHAEADSRLSRFIRSRTSLNIDPTWYVASVDILEGPEGLCTYPLIFANSLGAATTPKARQNLSEYLKRGGFLVVDACINRTINRSPDEFLRRNTEVFAELLPGSEVRPLPDNHEIYSCFFNVEEKPPHTYHEAQYDARWARHGLKGVFFEERMVAVITLSGLQCGWAGVPAKSRNHGENCMEMMLNIYIYAMTH